MKNPMIRVLLSYLILMSAVAVDARVLHSEKSLYRNIIVEESSKRRCMVFGRRSRHPDYQSCIDMKKPDYLVFSYTKLIMAGLTMLPQPQSILIIGLGGGTLPLSLEKLYPTSQIDTVEIDEAVVRVAEQWFGYKESDKQKAHVLDGRVFVKRQLRRQKEYDLIILDAFNGDYIPEHLMTEEFLGEIKALLSPEGLLIANTFSDNKLYHYESMTYQKVFGTFDYIHSLNSGNRVIYAKANYAKATDAATTESPRTSVQMSQVQRTNLSKIGVNFKEFEKLLTNKPDWKQNVRSLTDQFSPANLLKQR